MRSSLSCSSEGRVCASLLAQNEALAWMQCVPKENPAALCRFCSSHQVSALSTCSELVLGWEWRICTQSLKSQEARAEQHLC